jgi:molybdopterin-guanine dinucleotide biosynthesis protein A
MSDPSAMVVAILAGGEGSRIGGGKPLIRLGGSTLVEQAYELAQTWSKKAIVVVRSLDQLGTCPMPWITDAAGIAGPLAGLAAALDWAGREGAEVLLTIPCDMPFLPVDLAKRLAAGIGEMGAAIAVSSGNLHPVCGLWQTASLAEVPSYCATGKRSLRGFASQIGYCEVQWPTAGSDPFFNINSPDDLAAARARSGA